MSAPISLKRWAVCGPEIGTVEPILDDGTGPIEYGRDYVEIEAPTRREALVKGLRAFRKHDPSAFMARFSDWWNEGNPFAGMTAEVIEPCPANGYGYDGCDICCPAESAGSLFDPSNDEVEARR